MKTSEVRRRAAVRIKVQKKNLSGEVMVEYEGDILQRGENYVMLEALFTREDMPFMDVIFKKGDRFVEYFYADRWYNIFKIHDRDNGKVKGWYCNIGMPAEIKDNIVSYVDLALDLWVSADGKQTVLDEDEFEELTLTKELSAAALKGLEELKTLFYQVPPKI
jgi:predicted RNA-binding protein associated with RNAse of E/G family